MKVSHITEARAGLPTVVLLTEEQLDAAKKLLPETARAALGKFNDPAAKDAQNWLYNGEDHYTFRGLGPAAELTAERLRKTLHAAVQGANGHKHEALQIVFEVPADHVEAGEMRAALGEIPVLSNYQFLARKTQPEPNALKETHIVSSDKGLGEAVAEAVRTAEAVNAARDMVNEPPNIMTAVELAARAKKLGEETGFTTEIFDKAKIESLKMGGLLAVNRGSQTPPTFTIMEWKPGNAKNAKPYVLVGKGVTFDTGGLSLKPTAGSMDEMKSDMAGAAAVIGAMAAVSANKLPVHVIGLVPATDNRPGANAYTPNDVVEMYDGSTVEVLNTDAEGRMILADALAYAKQYDPELVIDLATLTGAAMIAVGNIGVAMMTANAETAADDLRAAGQATYERVAELPFWDEYAEQLKSDVADLKNIGGRPAGSITAGKFLQHFTDYPWAHLDIAGPAFLKKADGYRPKNGTGVGVRLLYNFFQRRAV